MTEEKWNELKGMIGEKFEVYNKGEEKSEDEGVDKIEFIIFEGPLGKMKLERLTKPVVLGKKTLFSNRPGSKTKVEYEYSKDEKNFVLKAYKWDEGTETWVEMEAGSVLG